MPTGSHSTRLPRPWMPPPCGASSDHTAKATSRAQAPQGDGLQFILGCVKYLLNDVTFNVLICKTHTMKRPGESSAGLGANTPAMLARSLANSKGSTQMPAVNSSSVSPESRVAAGCVPFPPLSLSTDHTLCHLLDVRFSQVRSKSEMKRVFVNNNNPNKASGRA